MLKKLITIPMALWLSMVFLGSLPYKFTNHPDTQHIFGIIWEWIGTFLGSWIGWAFSNYAGYVIGSLELVASLMVLSWILLWGIQATGFLKNKNGNILIALGWALAAGIMTWAAFFHIVSPLGIEVLHEWESDGGSLFKAAVSVFLIGFALFFMYKKSLSGTFIARLPIIWKII